MPRRALRPVEAAGANMWSTDDAFHFAWKKVSGDVALSADMTFPLPVNLNRIAKQS